jgi:hypothetical protein
MKIRTQITDVTCTLLKVGDTEGRAQSVWTCDHLIHKAGSAR